MSSTAAYKIVPVYICFVHFFPRGGHLGIFWVGVCLPGLQIGTHSKKNVP